MSQEQQREREREEDGLSPRVDISIPSAARIYDYLLGGKDNYPADRASARTLLSLLPDVRLAARANRRFLQRSVRMLAESGIDQFIDLGTGIPAAPNVHEIVHELHPDGSVVYVDHDPIVTAHNRAMKLTSDRVAVIQADVRRPSDIICHPDTGRLIDFSRPVAVLAVAVLHFVPEDDDPAGIVAAFREVMAPGSHMVISAASSESFSPDECAAIARAYRNATEDLSLQPRSAIERYFEGMELLGPGLVDVYDWQRDEPVMRSKLLVGIGRR